MLWLIKLLSHTYNCTTFKKCLLMTEYKLDVRQNYPEPHWKSMQTINSPTPGTHLFLQDSCKVKASYCTNLLLLSLFLKLQLIFCRPFCQGWPLHSAVNCEISQEQWLTIINTKEVHTPLTVITSIVQQEFCQNKLKLMARKLKFKAVSEVCSTNTQQPRHCQNK